MRTIWFLVALLFLVPLAGAQTGVARCTRECDPQAADVNARVPNVNAATRVILFGHPDPVLNKMVLSTQTPQDSSPPSMGLLLLNAAEASNCFRSTWTLSSSGVEYSADGSRRTNGGPGLAADLRLEPSGNVLYAYLRPHPSSPGAAVAVNAQVHVTIESGIEGGRGTVYARGTQSIPATALASDQLLEVRVPLTLLVPLWPGGEGRGFVGTVEVCQVEAAGSRSSPIRWSLEQRPGTYNRLILHTHNPLELRGFDATPFQGNLFLRLAMAVAFGSYDLNDTSVRVKGSNDQAVLDPRHIDLVIVKRSVDHDGNLKPVNVTWSVPLSELRSHAAWTFTVNAQNQQGTFELQATHTFSMVEFKGEPTPGPGPLLALALLGTIAVLARRRR